MFLHFVRLTGGDCSLSGQPGRELGSAKLVDEEVKSQLPRFGCGITQVRGKTLNFSLR